jgi:hypothetical protein
MAYSTGKEISAAPSLRFELTLLICVIAAAAWLLPSARHWLEARAAAHRAAAVVGDCAKPSEAEQLHIVFYHQGGRLVRECMYVATPGLYGRARR